MDKTNLGSNSTFLTRVYKNEKKSCIKWQQQVLQHSSTYEIIQNINLNFGCRWWFSIDLNVNDYWKKKISRVLQSFASQFEKKRRFTFPVSSTMAEN